MALGVVAFAVGIRAGRRSSAFYLGALLYVVDGLGPYAESKLLARALGFSLATLAEMPYRISARAQPRPISSPQTSRNRKSLDRHANERVIVTEVVQCPSKAVRIALMISAAAYRAAAKKLVRQCRAGQSGRPAAS